MTPFYLWGSTVSRVQIHYEETVYFLPLSPQEVLLFIWTTSEGLKDKLSLEPSCGFAPGAPGLRIQRANH